MNVVAKIVKECLGTGFSWGNSDNKTPKSSLEILREGFTAWGTRQHTPATFFQNDRLALEVNSHFKTLSFLTSLKIH